MSSLYEIRERAEGATPGPWKLWGMQVLADPMGNSNLDDALLIADTTDPHRGLRTFNAQFIASAREDIPRLVDALIAVEKRLGQWEERFTGMASDEVAMRAAIYLLREDIKFALEAKP